MPPATIHEASVDEPAVIVEAETQPGVRPALGEVIVRENAWLHAHPDSDIRVRLVALDDPGEPYPPYRFRVVADHGDWVELEAPVEEPDTVCVSSDYDLRALGLRVFVERDALLPVASRVVEVGFDDGTSVRLRPGTPIGPEREDGWRRIATSDATLYLPVPADAIGISFRDHGPPREAQATDDVDPELVLRFAGREVVTVAEYGDVRLASLAPAEGASRVLIDTPCLTAIVRATVSPGPAEGYGAGGLGLVGTGGGSVYDIAAGSPVFWSDGTPAGQLRRAQTMYEAPIERGALRCYPHILGYDGPVAERTVELCHDAEAVQLRER